MEKFFLALLAAAIALVAFCAGEICGPNQIYNECGSACPDYCFKNASDPCTLQCVPQCECIEGFKKEYIDSNNCVSSCAKAKQCPTNRIFYTCGTACPAYCGQPQPVKCTKNCVPECQCRPGFVLRDQHSSECIPAYDCPKQIEKNLIY